MVTKKVLLVLASILSLVIVSTSCYGSWNPWDLDNNVDNRIHNLVNISEKLPSAVTESQKTYSVVVFTDLHYGSKKDTVPESRFFEWLDSVKKENKLPRFAISLGDSADTGSQSDYDEYLKFCNRLKADYGIEMLNVPGNHDLYQSHWDIWQKNCFPNESFYSFKTDKFSWYALDTSSGSLGINQYNQLKAALEADPNPKIVYTHYPILEFNLVFGLCDTIERNLLIDLFVKNNVRCSLGGHLHYFAQDKLCDYQEYCLPSFRYKKTWSVLTVNEETQSVSLETVK